MFEIYLLICYTITMKQCIYCGKPFLSLWGKYCSHTCGNADYYLRNKDRILSRNKLWNKLNPEKVNAATLRYKKKYPEKNRHQSSIYQDRSRGAEGSHTLQEWNDLKKKYNYCCFYCGRREPEIKLTKDHFTPLSKGGTNYISNIRPSCKPCNSSKGTKLSCEALPTAGCSPYIR
jgi:5-methylcytosine-specific restriction endonuclease McrA